MRDRILLFGSLAIVLTVLVAGNGQLVLFAEKTTMAPSLMPAPVNITEWQLPQNDCVHPTCALVLHVSDDGSLYAYAPNTGTLSVFQPDGKLYGQYEPQAKGFYSEYVDFAPLNTDTVIIDSYEDGMVFQFTLSSQSMLWLNTRNLFGGCVIMPFMSPSPESTISRLGTTDNILGCTGGGIPSGTTPVPGSQICVLAIFNTSSRTETDIAKIGCTVEQWPWSSVLAGADGKVYLYDNAPPEASYGTSLTDALTPALAPLYAQNYLVLRYDPQVGKWDAVVIPRASVYLKGTLFEVDKEANIYFYYQSGVNPPNFQLTKIAPSGAVVWSLTEKDLPGTSELAGVTSDGTLVLVSSSPSSTADAQVLSDTIVPPTPMVGN